MSVECLLVYLLVFLACLNAFLIIAVIHVRNDARFYRQQLGTYDKFFDELHKADPKG